MALEDSCDGGGLIFDIGIVVAICWILTVQLAATMVLWCQHHTMHHVEENGMFGGLFETASQQRYFSG